MNDKNTHNHGIPIPFGEFIALMALLISLVALSIDAVLPALQMIGEDLNVADINHTQLVISFLFGGFMFGQLVYGPASDSFGRKRMIYFGLGLFLLGSALSLTAQSFEMMLAGRALQGFGAASSRIITIAMTRDLFKGREMARVMSIIMSIFIFVPALAPALGQGVMFVADWRAIFIVFLVVAAIAITWMSFRLPETLAHDKRRPFSPRAITAAVREVLSHRITLGYTVCAGLIFGSLIGYLTSARQVFQDYFAVGEWFAVCFAISAFSIGIASVVNSRIVMRFGMKTICHYALLGMAVTSAAFLLGFVLRPEPVPFWAFMAYVPVAFFCLGLQFGNVNALAMEPMGHMAGIASAVIGSFSTLISVTLGTVIGQAYDHSLTPLIGGFFVLSSSAFLLQAWLNRSAEPTAPQIVE